MQMTGKADLAESAMNDDTASRIFYALEYLARIARNDNFTAIAAHIETALEASLNDYVEEKRAVLAASQLAMHAPFVHSA
jgi:hypothetical protein